MQRDIKWVYKSKELIREAKKRLYPAIPFEGVIGDKYFDKIEIGRPLVMSEGVARDWLELNYVFATHFMPKRRPGIGEIGAEVEEGKIIIDTSALKKLRWVLERFRDIETDYEDWIKEKEQYEKLTSTLSSICLLNHIPVDCGIYIGERYMLLPNTKFVDSIKSAGIVDKNIVDRLERIVKRYAHLVSVLLEIEEHYTTIPYVDDMIRLDSPPVEGDITMHTHPGFDDLYEALPSNSDVGIFAMGGKQRYYVMRVPNNGFFRDVQKIVDSKALDEYELINIKREKALPAIKDTHILGFCIEKHGRNALLRPVINERGYERYEEWLNANGLYGEDMNVREIELDTGKGKIEYEGAMLFHTISSIEV
ncbi:MAG TPA: hypothetical protein ENG42_03605 [Candidatus Aenigmarchaeota archaeon]|nr:MAG: hypothetical protein DRP03_00320 [Candidatus Aenigmarchaeota archaeon]HDD46538.1 hypothetical protein [Candidatus Aenigmarchaeota archaeon]